MPYLGSAEDLLREYEAHCWNSAQWYHQRSWEERIAIAQRAIELPGIPFENFDRLIPPWLN